MAYTAELTDRARQYLGELESLLNWLHEAIDGMAVPPQRQSAILALMLAATYRRARGVVGELRGGSIEGLRSATRSLIENLINASYLSADPTLTKTRTGAYLADGIRERRKMANAYWELLQEEGADQNDIDRTCQAIRDRRAELEQLERDYGEKSLNWLTLEGRAKKAGVQRLYAIGYRTFSQDVHVSLAYLERFLDRSADQLTLDLTPDDDLVESMLSAIYVHLVGMVNTCNERVRFAEPSMVAPLEAVAERLKAEDGQPGASRAAAGENLRSPQ